MQRELPKRVILSNRNIPLYPNTSSASSYPNTSSASSYPNTSSASSYPNTSSASSYPNTSSAEPNFCPIYKNETGNIQQYNPKTTEINRILEENKTLMERLRENNTRLRSLGYYKSD
jgi:hypothetical protein